jgi:hypothetical protein
LLFQTGSWTFLQLLPRRLKKSSYPFAPTFFVSSHGGRKVDKVRAEEIPKKRTKRSKEMTRSLVLPLTMILVDDETRAFVF